MKTQLKYVARAVMFSGLFVLGLGVVQKAEAANPDTMKVYVTPSAGSFNYAVSITSPAVNHQGYDFGQVALQASTISTKAIVVTNTGNVGEYFALAISNSTPDNWSAIPTGVPAHNQFTMMGHFVDTGLGQPLDATFSTSVDTMTATLGAGSANFGQSAVTPPSGANAKDLYLKLVMPTTVTSALEQTMTLIVNGQPN